MAVVTSRYQIIWTRLKKNKSISLAAPAEAHFRLMKAIKKRKNLDIGYKVLLGEENRVATLQFKSEGALLKVTLHIKTRSLWI